MLHTMRRGGVETGATSHSGLGREVILSWARVTVAAGDMYTLAGPVGWGVAEGGGGDAPELWV